MLSSSPLVFNTLGNWPNSAGKRASFIHSRHFSPLCISNLKSCYVKMSSPRFSFFDHSLECIASIFSSKRFFWWISFLLSSVVSGFHFSALQSVPVPLGSYYSRLVSHCPPAVHIDCQQPLGIIRGRGPKICIHLALSHNFGGSDKSQMEIVPRFDKWKHFIC